MKNTFYFFKNNFRHITNKYHFSRIFDVYVY